MIGNYAGHDAALRPTSHFDRLFPCRRTYWFQRVFFSSCVGFEADAARRFRFTAEADPSAGGVRLVRATVCDSAVMFSQRSPRNARAVFSALWHSIKVCVQYHTESITRECHA
jgi:hypothetical protein